MLVMQSHEIMDHINSRLFEHEHNRVRAMIEKMIIRSDVQLANREGAPFQGFLFDGTHYRAEVRRFKDNKLPCLPIELMREMEEIQSDSIRLFRDRQQIGQALLGMVLKCTMDQDVRDNLPDMLMPMLPHEISRLSRSNEEAFSIKNDERKYRQYMSIRERIEFYTATRLFY